MWPLNSWEANIHRDHPVSSQLFLVLIYLFILKKKWFRVFWAPAGEAVEANVTKRRDEGLFHHVHLHGQV